MYRMPFVGKEVKGQGHMGRTFLKCWPLAAKGCLSY